MATQGMQERIVELRKRRAEAKLGGGADKLEKHRAGGKLTARERIEALVDPDSFEETGLFARHRATALGMEGKELPADGVVTGAASIHGRLVHLASQDFTVAGGSAGEIHSTKVAEIMVQSLKTGSPFVFVNDSGGARVQEGIDSLSGYGKVFHANVMLSGAVPRSPSSAARAPAARPTARPSPTSSSRRARRRCSSPARRSSRASPARPSPRRRSAAPRRT
jgi:methylmalonyl-CoA carboxyltransferase large subunit